MKIRFNSITPYYSGFSEFRFQGVLYDH